MTFALNTLVWLKQPDYPWWPGIVLDPAAVGMTVPAGLDTCVLCLPSASSSVAFANSGRAEEIVPFDPAADAALLAAGRADAQCAAAIEEAIGVHEQQTRLRAEGERDGRERRESPIDRRHHRHRREKKRSRRQHNTSDEDESNGASSDDGGTRKKNRRSGKKMGRTDMFDEADHDKNVSQFAFVDEEDGASYLEHIFRRSRRAATDSTLDNTRHQLESLATACVDGGVVSVSRVAEEQILDALSPLTLMSVTFHQLCCFKIGVAVGRFLSRGYPVRIRSLALALLRFWFFQLPPEIRQRLIEHSARSNTIANSERQVMPLGAAGVQFETADDDGAIYNDEL